MKAIFKIFLLIFLISNAYCEENDVENSDLAEQLCILYSFICHYLKKNIFLENRFLNFFKILSY